MLNFKTENFEIVAVRKDANLVELEKCCQTHIFLQTFVLIQPRTSPVKFPRSRGLPGWFRGVSFGSESEEAGRLEPSPRLLKLSSFLAESSAFFADFVADISQYAILLNSQKSQKFVNIWLREVRPMKIPSRRACPVSQWKIIVSMKIHWGEKCNLHFNISRRSIHALGEKTTSLTSLTV